MSLSRNALGNLLNRYRAVLKKCRLLNVFGSLALAGLLAMGGQAIADPVAGNGVDPDTGNATVGNGSTLTVGDGSSPSSFTANDVVVESNSEIIIRRNVNISLKSLTVNNGGAVYLAQQNNAAKDQLGQLLDGIVTLGGGDGSGEAKLDIGSSRAGGNENVHITFAQANFATGAAQAGKIKMNASGRIRVHGTTYLTGSALQLSDVNGFHAEEHASEPTIKTGGLDIASNAFTFSKGKLYVDGTGNSFVTIGNNKGTLILSDASMRLGDSDPSSWQGGPVAGGKIKGNITVGNAAGAGELKVASGAWTMDGDLTLGNSMSRVTIGGDKVSTSAGQLDQAARFVLEGDLVNNGATIHLGTLGELTIARNASVSNKNGKIHVGTNNGVDGVEANLNISPDQLKKAASEGFVSVAGLVSDSELGKYSYIRLGSKDAYQDASFETRNFATSADAATGLYVGAHGSLSGAGMTLIGNSLDLAADARIHSQSKGMILSGTDGSNRFTVVQGKLAVMEGYLKGANGVTKLALGNGNVPAGANHGSSGELRLGHNGDVTGPGTIDLDIEITKSGNMEVQSGHWTTARSINVMDGGILMIGDESGKSVKKASLTIQKGGDLLSARPGVAQGDHQGVTVLGNAYLAAEKETLLVEDKNASNGAKFRIKDGLGQIYVASAGELHINGIASVSLEDMKNIGNALLVAGSQGSISYGNAEMPGGELGSSDAETVKAQMPKAKVKYNNGNKDKIAENGGYGAQSIVIDAADVPSATVAQNSLTVFGDANGNFIVDNKGNAVGTINVGNTKAAYLNLGSVSVDGAVNTTSNIMLGHEDSSVSSISGTNKVGSIETATAGTGEVVISHDSSLTASHIGNDKAVGQITVNASGSLTAGNIKSANINVNGGSLVAATITTSDHGEGKKGHLNLANGQVVAESASVAGNLTATDTETVISGTITVNGEATISGKSFSGKNADLKKGGKFVNGVSASLETLTAGGNIEVGSDDAETDQKGGSELVLKKLVLGGKSLLVDPEFGLPSSNVAVLSMGTAETATDVSLTVDGKVAVGKNSMVALGTDDKTWLPGRIATMTGESDLRNRAGGVTAALGLFKPIVLGDGYGIRVDGSKSSSDSGFEPAANELAFAAGSLLVVNAKAGEAASGAISAKTSATANVASGAKLMLAGASAGKTYKVLGDKITIGDYEGWKEQTELLTDNSLLGLERDGDSGSFKTVARSAGSTLPGIDGSLAGLLDRGIATGEIGGDQIDSGFGGRKFLSRAIHVNYLGNDRAAAARTIEGAARMTAVAAVPQLAMGANLAGANAVTQRTSIAMPTSPIASVSTGARAEANGMTGLNAGDSLSAGNSYDKTGLGLWIMPLWQSNNNYGMKAGNFKSDMHSNIGGVAIGADYTFAGAVRAGLTFNIGGGYARGGGDFATTQNNMNFWGLGAYLGLAVDNFGLTADLGYTSSYNIIKQELDPRLGMADLKSDVRASAISTGLRGEYRFDLGSLDITPHLGVRYTNLQTDEHNVRSAGQKVLKVDGMSQNIWTFPIGVQFAKAFETGNGWYVKPAIDLGIVPAAGDIMAKNDVRFNGVSGTASSESQTMDWIGYTGQAGVEFGNKALKLGLNYNLQLGAHSTSHGLSGTLRYEF